MEDHFILQDSAKSCDILMREDEREKVKDFVFRHFREVTDSTLLMEHGGVIKDRAPLTRSRCRSQQGAVFSGKILSFGCSECKDSSTYSPNDLLKHFRAAHQGALPTYPCDLCGFITNEFPALQRHRIEHRNTLVTCELCHDGVQYSLLLLTRHYIMCHSVNGQFTCDWCHFTTVDAGTFVQHIHHHKETSWMCAKCSHISLSEKDHQKHLKAHSAIFPFTCQICGYGSARNENLKKHIANVHKSEKKSLWTAIEDNGTALNSSASLKLLLKKTPPPSGESQESQLSKGNIISGSIPNQNGRLSDEVSEDASERRDIRNCNKICKKGEQPSAEMVEEEEEHSSSSDLSHTSPNGLTVLRLKNNKLSLPPNCTTKVIGFKMVDGKKHLVLKVIHASSQECSYQENYEDVGSFPNQLDQRKPSENGECSNDSTSALDCLEADDVMTVKVKVEEEEASICTPDCSPNDTALEELSSSMAFTETCHMTNNCDHVANQCQTACPERTKAEGDSGVSGAKNDTGSIAAQSNMTSVENCEAAIDTHITTPKTGQQNIQNIVRRIVPSSCNSGISLLECTTQSVPNQEVFTFHNYSKETSSSQLSFGQNLDGTSELSAEREAESPHFSLKLAEPSEPAKAREAPPVDLNECGLRDTESSSELEVDECIADVEVEENPESVLQDFNIIKVEEDNIPITKPQPDNPPFASVGFVKEHSDAIIHQQLNKERNESAAAASININSAKQNKTTVKILQIPEGKQPLLLRTAENHFAMPVQVKASPGFKLITNSTNPHINVSYMKSATERMSKPGFVLGPNNRVGFTTGKVASKQGITNSSNHYLISSDLKGPLLLPKTSNSLSTDRPTKTCYVLQKSLPGVQTPSVSGLRLASTQLPLKSRPLLAVPVSSAESSANMQSGRQTFFLRYVSPSKSAIPVYNQDTRAATKPIGPFTQPNESSGNKVIFKIVSPSTSLLSNGTPVSHSQPVLLATRPQTKCFLVSPNQANLSAGLKKIIAVQNSFTGPRVLHSLNVKAQSSEADKPMLAPRPVRPPSQRKRRRKQLFEEMPDPVHKPRKLSNKVLPEREPPALWSSVSKDVERTLELSPLSSGQEVKCPRRYQPVVVLNHPDADIPEVASIMKVVQRHRGAVTKVSLSQNTVQALANLSSSKESSSQSSVQSSVRERYLLKLKLRKKSKKKYRVVRTVPEQPSVVFTCWFCGRLFNRQEQWIGHGQRHLMEATRDWNTLNCPQD